MPYAALLAILELAGCMSLWFAFMTKVCWVRILRFHKHAFIIAIGLCASGHSIVVFLLRIVSDATLFLFFLAHLHRWRLKICRA